MASPCRIGLETTNQFRHYFLRISVSYEIALGSLLYVFQVPYFCPT
jgi:hypothetical protein